MDLNGKLSIEINFENSKNEDFLEKRKAENQENNINNMNINQSNGSIRTTEYSSESGEVISKFLINNNSNTVYKFKVNQTIKNNTENTKNNQDTTNKNKENESICKGKRNIESKKNKKAPKFGEYNSEYLSESNIHINAPNVPLNYKCNFNVDNFTNQNILGAKEFLKTSDDNTYMNNEEYKKIKRIPHDKLSHMLINENFYINENEKKYHKFSISQRVKHKFLTILYFSPKEKKNRRYHNMKLK